MDLFKPRLFRHDQSKDVSPLERSEIMYKEGTEKLQRLNESARLNASYYCEDLTLRPKINKRSQKLVRQRDPERSVVESLYSDAQRRIREQSEGTHSQDKENKASLAALRQSERLLAEKLERELQLGVTQLEIVDGDEALTLSQFEQFLDAIGYLNAHSGAAQDENRELCRHVWGLLGCADRMSKHKLRIVLFAIHNVWQPQWMLARPKSDGQTQPSEFFFEAERDFGKLHQLLQVLQIQRGQNSYHQQRRFIQLYNQAAPQRSPGRVLQESFAGPQSAKAVSGNPLAGWFKPQICKKSEALDRAQREKLDKTLDRNTDRPLMMIGKGLQYKEKAAEKRREQAAHETDGCTFTPAVNAKFTKVYKDPTVALRYKGELDRERVFGALYEKRPGPRQARSPLDIEFEKQRSECSFKPAFMNPKKLQASSPRINSGLRPELTLAPGPHKKSAQNYAPSKGNAKSPTARQPRA